MKVWKEIDQVSNTENRLLVQINQLQFTIINIQQEYYGIESSCPHSGGPLGSGDIEDLHIKCPWHGYRYYLIDGSCEDDPDHSAEILPVKFENGKLYIQVLSLDQITIFQDLDNTNAKIRTSTVCTDINTITEQLSQTSPQRNKSLIDWGREILDTRDVKFYIPGMQKVLKGYVGFEPTTMCTRSTYATTTLISTWRRQEMRFIYSTYY